MKNRYDTVVIGAGLAGLSATAQLSKSGHRVLLLERNAELGGRARTDELDGTLFNQGGHALYRNGLGHTALRQLGVEPDGEPPPLAGAQLLNDGQTSLLPADALGLLRTRGLSVGGKVQFGKLMARLPRLDPRDFADVTVDSWLSGYRPEVQAAGKALVRLSTYAAATDLMSADAAIGQLQGATDGVLYLHGGWTVLCRQLAVVAEAAGATISSGCSVVSCGAMSPGFEINTADERFEADALIVAAGGPAFTARLLGIEPSIFGVVGPAPEAAVLDLVLDSMPSKHRFVLGVDEPTYFSVHGPPARLAADGKVAAVAMRYLRPDDDGSAEEHRASLHRIAQVAGVGEPSRERFLRRMTVTNGLPLATSGGMAGRPGVGVPDMPGAYIAGDWVGAQGLLADAAIMSGVEAASAVEHTLRASVRAD